MAFGCGCAIQLFCWICLLFAALIFIGFVLSISEAMLTESTFCSRSQLLIGAECATKTRQLEDSLLRINRTVRFLRPPSEYKEVIELCEKAEICLNQITCEDGHDFVMDVKDTFPACDFYKLYAGEFEECANTLRTKTSNYSCLKSLFDAKYGIKYNRCQQWRDIQPCVHDAIRDECDGNSTQLAFRFGEVTADFYRAMNCVPSFPRVSSGEIDYEIVGLVSGQ
ncbi:unnamed protein product [Caenorhabditis sp. 36 PRJEB53466]|nr:unnamed protein product [Caenorhabditis sp. 36 PRJEB53466]